MSSDRYSRETIRSCLENLHELRALVLPGDGREGSPSQARHRGTLLCMLWDLEAAIPQLPPPLREAVYWSYEEALPDREAARVIGICHRALQKRVTRAVESLEKLLADGRHTPSKFTLTNMEAKR